MKAIVQRVIGKTTIDSTLNGVTSHEEMSDYGLLVLLGWEKSDEELESKKLEANEIWLMEKIIGLRIFPDENQKMNWNLKTFLESKNLHSGGILWVPQFTLSATLDSGFRPSFTAAMNPQLASARFSYWRKRSLEATQPLKSIYGIFSADMTLSFSNWGPVTIPISR